MPPGGSGLGRPLHLTSRSAPAPRFRYPAKEIVDRLPADILIFAAAGAIGYCQHADPASRLSGISALLQKRRFQHRQPCERFLGMATNHSDRFGEPRIVVFSIEAFGIVKRRQFESEIAQQPIPQAVDPTVNGERTAGAARRCEQLAWRRPAVAEARRSVRRRGPSWPLQSEAAPDRARSAGTFPAPAPASDRPNRRHPADRTPGECRRQP